MPRVTIAPENRVGEPLEAFPKLKLKEGERRRIWCPPDTEEPRVHKPMREWVHNIKAPKFENNEPKMVTRTRQDGTTFPTYDLSFINNPICLGEDLILADKGIDTGSCPACEAAMRLQKTILKPQVRYASEIIVYETKPGGWELAPPFRASIMAWTYPAGRYGKLVDIGQAEGRDISQFDLRLGPCEKPEDFQKYEIQAIASQKPAWAASDATKAFFKELWHTEGARPTDEQLRALCGRDTERAFMVENIKQAEALWIKAEGVGPAASDTLGAEFTKPQALGEGLGALLGEVSKADVPAKAAATESIGTETATTSIEDVLPDAPAAKEGEGEVVSFEDFDNLI